jgi:hypothetical protein
LIVDIENLSCELANSPTYDTTKVPFRMFDWRKGVKVDYYNFMPVVPCWEKYDL